MANVIVTDRVLTECPACGHSIVASLHCALGSVPEAGAGGARVSVDVEIVGVAVSHDCSGRADSEVVASEVVASPGPKKRAPAKKAQPKKRAPAKKPSASKK